METFVLVHGAWHTGELLEDKGRLFVLGSCGLPSNPGGQSSAALLSCCNATARFTVDPQLPFDARTTLSSPGQAADIGHRFSKGAGN